MSTSILRGIGPEFWTNQTYWQDRQGALDTIESLIQEGSAIATLASQQSYQDAYIAFLESLYQEW